ncbi:MAG: DMT family transporter [Beijerinckiaceae bacterium]
MKMSLQRLILAAVPVVFVIIWSTGWISAKYAAPHADPLWFLTIRFVCAGLAIALFATLVGAPWPKDRRAWMHGIVSGILLHGLYLGGVWWAVKHGLSAGLSGLLVALQPLLTALLGPALLKEKITPVQWAGVAVGLVGVIMVLSPRIGLDLHSGAAIAGDVPWLALAVNIIGVIGITAGSFYQKRFVAAGDLRTVTAVQYLGALLLIAPLSLALEDLRFDHSFEVYATLAWSVIVLSVFAIALMLMMINRGEVTRVSALIYLVPATVALQAWAIFGETLNAIQIAGMVTTAAGVYLATLKR